MGGRRIRIAAGWRSVNIILVNRKVCIKAFSKRHISNARREYEALRRLCEAGISVPRPYRLILDGNPIVLVREYVEGMHFWDALKQYSQQMLAEVLLRLLRELRAIEDLGLYVPEISTLTKNVIVSGVRPYIIDLEGAKPSKSLIVTQFLSLIHRLGRRGDNIGQKIRNIFDTEDVLGAAREYKRSRDMGIVVRLFRCLRDAELDNRRDTEHN